MRRKYTDEELINAVKESKAIRQVLTKLNLREAGGNYFFVAKRIKELKIDISHFHGRGWRKGTGKPFKDPIPLKDILVKNSTYTNINRLRKRLIDEGVFEAKCYNCKNTEWLGIPISLELEHKDGDRTNHSRENLTILCPNCHAQTKFYRAKNMKSYRDKVYV